MGNTRHEDAIMKMGFSYFRDTILKVLGIDYQFLYPGPTELVELIIQSMYMDFTFLTDQDFYIHTEFQTTDGKDPDLRRFHAYDAVFSHNTGKNVITYVIFSGGITEAKTELDCGDFTYRVRPVFLTGRDADPIFRRLHEKQQSGEPFTEEDYADLSLTPLLSGSRSRKDAILDALLLTKPDRTITAQKAAAVLYTMADKFLDNDDLKQIKEVVTMTRLGQMIFDDGQKAGIQQGQTGMLKSLILKKLQKNTPIPTIARELETDEETVLSIIAELQTVEK